MRHGYRVIAAMLLAGASVPAVASENPQPKAQAAFAAIQQDFVKDYMAELGQFNALKLITRSGPIAGSDDFFIVRGQGPTATIERIDPATGTATQLFDLEALRAQLAGAGSTAEQVAAIDFSQFAFLQSAAKVRVPVGTSHLVFDLGMQKVEFLIDDAFATAYPGEPKKIADQYPGTSPPLMENGDASFQRFVTVKDSNLHIRNAADGSVRPLTTDGERWHSWGGPGLWEFQLNAFMAPNGKHVFAVKVDGRDVFKLPIMYWLEPKERVDHHLFPLTGEAMPQRELNFVDVETGKLTRLASAEQKDTRIEAIGWRSDSSEVWFTRSSRSNNRVDLMAASPATGQVRTVLTEASKTYVDDPYTGGPQNIRLLEGGGVLLLSERTGWRHIYRYDNGGKLIRQLTSGDWPVHDIVEIDEAGGWVYFLRPTSVDRPYDRILFRAPLRGGKSQRLVQAPGQHEVVFNPKKSAFLVRASSITAPPVDELRRADGSLIRQLAAMSITDLPASWSKSQEFTVKARDGVTDIHGVIMVPPGFSPEKRYPVIEMIYGGMQADFVPKAFLDTEVAGNNGYGKVARGLTLAENVVVLMNTAGTRNRGKAFQDATWRTWPQNLVEEHAAVIRELGKSRPWMDLNRVGLAGASWGGYMTLRGLIKEPDLYRAGVALVPVARHDQTLQATEPYIGTPADNPSAYAEGNLLDKVQSISGDVLLISGPLDVNANFAQTMKFVDAMIAANKNYELYVMPAMNHSIGCCGPMRSIHVQAKMIDFFQKSLGRDLDK